VELKQINISNNVQVSFFNKFINKNMDTTPKELKPLKMDSLGKWYYLTDSSNLIIGLVGCYKITPNVMEVKRICIDRNFRGKGYGYTLIKLIEELAEQNGYTKVYSKVYTTNETMLHIKEAKGWVKEGLHQDHDLPGVHHYSMAKFLKETDGA
jgi:RimJ/RimL family protein N-acetyltransferase